ncbi:MAG: TIGR02757 family protein [Bacteroidetes bacterium]|nr:TIGR02757 family protein [Bacteroidota bacterium]
MNNNLLLIKDFLDDKVRQYNTTSFIENDPISVPHRYTKKEDIEIAGFLAATIAWGNRKIIVRNAHKMLDFFGESPFDFVMQHKQKHLRPMEHFVHRTFNGTDLLYFVSALQHIYKHKGGIEAIFNKYSTAHSTQEAIHQLKNIFFEIKHPSRSTKHLSDPMRGSAAKKINMYLRWMVRHDKQGVDFGIWKQVKPHQLSCPLDVHSGNIARELGLLVRTQNDAKAVQELDKNLRLLDAKDPVKYDFALFGLGAMPG